MLDLFSGLGGASQAMVDRGWRVIRVELEEKRQPTIVADVANLPIKPFSIDLLWASPPCLEYSRIDQPWFVNPPLPDLSLWQATERAINELAPRFWIIENVRGARKVWGKDCRRFGSHWLWSNIPLWVFAPVERNHKYIKGIPSNDRAAHRAKIPYVLSEAIASMIEGFSL